MHASSQHSDPDATDAENGEVGDGDETAAETGPDDQDAAESAAAAEAFEHLARIRSGISEGVITPW